MPRSLLAILFVLSFACVGFSQQSPTTGTQPAQANPRGNATTQADMNQCTPKNIADAHLNTVYQHLARLLQKDTGEMQPPCGDGQKKADTLAVEKLRAAQRQWILYRDLHRGAVKAQYEDGSIAVMQWSACMTETANHRVEELKHGYETEDRKLE